MFNVLKFSYGDFGMNFYYTTFFILFLICMFLTIIVLIKQSIFKKPFLSALGFLVSFISFAYYFMMKSTDIDTATLGLYVYHLMLPFVMPTTLIHIDLTYNHKPVTAKTYGYYIFPVAFLTLGTLFSDSYLFFKSKTIIKSTELTLIELESGTMYYLFYVFLIFSVYILISRLLLARKSMNLEKIKFRIYSICIVSAAIFHITYVELKFVKIDLFIILLLIMVISLILIRFKHLYTIKSEKVISIFINQLENPFISLDKSYNILTINETGKQFAKNHFYLSTVNYDTLSKCNWPDFIQNYKDKSINLFDDYGIKALRFNVKNITDNSGNIVERLLIFYNYTSYLSLENKYEYSLKKDSLTKTTNRTDLLELVEQMFEKCITLDRDMSLFTIEIEDLHKINAHISEFAGDYVLKKTSRIILQTLRNSDIIGRYSGNKFLIVFPDTSYNRAKETAHNIVQKIESSEYQFNGTKFYISIVGGVVNFRNLGETPKDYNQFIDLSLKELRLSKRSGSNNLT